MEILPPDCISMSFFNFGQLVASEQSHGENALKILALAEEYQNNYCAPST